MSVISYRKSLKDLNLLDSFLFSTATVDPNNAKLIATALNISEKIISLTISLSLLF